MQPYQEQIYYQPKGEKIITILMKFNPQYKFQCNKHKKESMFRKFKQRKVYIKADWHDQLFFLAV